MKQNRTPMAKAMLKDLKNRQAKIMAENLLKAKVDFFNNQKVETSTKSSRWGK
jgi:hypothetical protein